MRVFKSVREFRAAYRGFDRALNGQMNKGMRDIAVHFVGVCRDLMTQWIYNRPIPTKRKRRVYTPAQRQILKAGGRVERGYRYKAFKSDKLEWHAGQKLASKSRRLWTRTGYLRRSERWQFLHGRFAAVMIYNAAAYAFRRHWLRRTRFPGMVMAPAPWRPEAIRQTEGFRKARMTRAVFRSITDKLA